MDDEDTTSSSNTSLSLGSATINDATTAKEVFVNNFELKLNPTFTINGETATYENSTAGDFPVASNESLKVVYSPESTGLKVTFSFDSGALMISRLLWVVLLMLVMKVTSMKLRL